MPTQAEIDAQARAQLANEQALTAQGKTKEAVASSRAYVSPRPVTTPLGEQGTLSSAPVTPSQQYQTFTQTSPQITTPTTTPQSPAPTPNRPILTPSLGSQNVPGSSEGGTGGYYDPNIPKPRTENEIRDEQLKRAQAMIDATEAIYQQELGRLTKEGQGRLAQTSSIQVAAGLAGSPFQQTAETQSQEYTNQQLQARQAQRSAEIARMMAEANDRATDQYDKEIARYQQEREFAMSQQEKDLARKKTVQTEMRTRLADLAKGGYSISEIPEADYNKLLSDSGLTDFEARAVFSSNSPSTATQYTTSGNKLIQYYFDPRTKETKISTIDIPGVEDNVEYNSQIVQGQDGQSYMVFSPKNPKSLEDLQANTLMKPIGGQEIPKEDELTKAQKTSTFNRIVDTYNKSPLIAASDRTEVLKNAIKEAKADPKNGANQLSLVYSYVQALDTYQSAVREGELSLVSSIDSKIGQLSNSIEKIRNGQIVRADVINQIADTADNLVSTIDRAAKNKAKSFQSQADVAGVGDEWNQYISGFQQGYGNETPGAQLPKLTKSYTTLDSLVTDHPENQDIVGRIEQSHPQATDQEILQLIEEQNAFNGDLSKSENGSQAQSIAQAIKQVESSGNYQAKGASGEFGAYQFMPSTWKSWAKKYLGNTNAPLTPENQDKVAISHIQSLLAQGHSPREIALIWNGGQPVVKKGINSKGVKYDSGAYAEKVLKALG